MDTKTAIESEDEGESQRVVKIIYEDDISPVSSLTSAFGLHEQLSYTSLRPEDSNFILSNLYNPLEDLNHLSNYDIDHDTHFILTTTNCLCDPCKCDDPNTCVCKPCECDAPLNECICNPCVCDPPPLQECICKCDPCECDPPILLECICNPCNCDLPLGKCICNPCECEIPLDENESKFDIFSPRNDHGKAFFDKLQMNLFDIQKEYCNQNICKECGVKLTENLIMKLLIKESNGKNQVYLPGNQIYPTILKSRIGDDDIPCITNVLLQMRSVTSLNLAYNNITDVGMTMLASTIQECGNIENVNLMNNDFTSEGIVALTKALLYRPPLASLKLNGVKFGIEGIDALACLIMGGHSPKDFDLSECDLSVDGFQTICTALYSLDHGIDYPNYLLSRPLPIDLVTLKSIRYEYNEDMSQLRVLDQNLSDTDYIANAKPSTKNQFYVPHDQEAENIIEDSVPEILEEFSANVLEGLFDLRHRLSEEIIPVDSLQRIYPNEYIGEIIKTSKAMGDVTEIIAEFNSGKNIDGHNRLPIVSPSLYEMDYSSVTFTDDVDNSTREERNRPSIMSRISKSLGQLNKVIDSTDSKTTNRPDNLDMPSPDEFTAQLASKEMTEFLLTTASETVGKSEIPPTTDIVQLVLMSIGDIAELQRVKDEEGIEFTDDKCMKLLEEAMERVANLLSPKVPSECKLTDTELKRFVQAFFKSSHKIFMKLFKNPYICMALAQEGTIACRERQKMDAEEIIKPHCLYQPTVPELRYIATQFLDGAIKEAGRMIGTGDPFGFHDSPHNKKKSDEFENALKTLLITEEVFETEDDFEGLVQGLLETSGRMAAATKLKARKVQKADKDFKMIADVFIEDLFKHVFTTLRDYQTQKIKNYIEDESDDHLAQLETLGHYPFISRPTRLVLNRPFFQHHEELMGSKLGDFIRDNKTIKALHIQKWNLGEDGMIALMNGLLFNTTLVLLDLANNELAADGVKLLGVYLGVNTNLKHLILNHNRLKDPGILHLVKNLKDSGLNSLNIAYNNITWVGLDPLLTILPCTKIRSLYLWGNSFGLATWDLLNSLIKHNTLRRTDLCLQVVDGCGCVVKNSQLRDINFWYEVPPIVEKGLYIPPYYLDRVHEDKPPSTYNFIH